MIWGNKGEEFLGYEEGTVSGVRSGGCLSGLRRGKCIWGKKREEYLG